MGVSEKTMDNPMQSPWRKGLMIAHSMPRCGAKARTNNGLPCKAVAMANGRCRMHGGTNPGAPCGKEHGRYLHGGCSKKVVSKLQQYRECLHGAIQLTKGLV